MNANERPLQNENRRHSFMFLSTAAYAPVVQKVDNAIHSAIGFPNTYPLDGIHLVDKQRYPTVWTIEPWWCQPITEGIANKSETKLSIQGNRPSFLSVGINSIRGNFRSQAVHILKQFRLLSRWAWFYHVWRAHSNSRLSSIFSLLRCPDNFIR